MTPKFKVGDKVISINPYDGSRGTTVYVVKDSTLTVDFLGYSEWIMLEGGVFGYPENANDWDFWDGSEGKTGELFTKVETCRHANRYLQKFTTFQFMYCPDCKREV